MGRCGVAVSVGVVVVALGATASAAERPQPPRAVIELFTSQGCSSCPPADKLLGELASDPTVLAISVPIDYWDYLGWKDTLALARHTARQRAYAAMRGDRDVYTPQAVINGQTHVVGNDKGAIERTIQLTRSRSTWLSVPVTATVAGDRLNVAVQAEKAGPVKAEIWVCALTSNVPVAIGRGENSGRTIIYHNVVRRWFKLDDWAGAARSWQVAIPDVAGDGADAVAVLVQAGTDEKPGPMLGAALAKLH